MWRAIGRFLLYLFAVIGVLAVLVAVLLGWATLNLIREAGAPAAPPGSIVLRLDLRQPLRDGPPQPPLLAALAGREQTLHETIEAIDRAAEDDRVVALVAHLGGDVFGLALAQELRAAVGRFRDSGKPAYAYADTLGEFGSGNASYYLATGFDSIWVRPTGSVGLTGLRAEVPFAAELLSDIGVEAEVVRRGRFKTVPETFTEDAMPPAHREMLNGLLGDLFDQLAAGIADGRGLDAAAVESLIDDGPYMADEALDAGLIDRLDSLHALEAELDERFGEGAEPVEAPRYLAAIGARDVEPEGRIALIYATGMIVLGEDQGPSLFGPQLMVADRIAEAIDAAASDAGIDAIVLRVDSGGGSAVASDVIGQAVQRADEQGTPVIVSMGSAAASGGYWISAPAAEIVAQPATLTGSIGVFAGNLDTRALWEELGVNWDSVQRGENADLWSNIAELSPSGRERVNALVDAIYGDFIALVAAGRGLDRGAVEELAQGRVWSGAQAEARGLVDRLGGLEAALAAVRDALELAEGAPLTVEVRPEPASPLEQLAGWIGVHAVAEGPAAAALRRLEPMLARAAPLLRPPGEGILRMPPLRIGAEQY
jgi:protease-4